MEARVTVEGMVFAPTRRRAGDFTDEATKRQVRYDFYVTDVVQITEDGQTLIVPVRSDYPLVEKPVPGEVLTFPCRLQGSASQAPKLTYAPPAAPAAPANGQTATADPARTK